MNYYGNLALYPERKRPDHSPREKGKKTKPVVSKKKLVVRERVLYLLILVFIVCSSSFIIFRYARIYEMNAKIQATERAYAQSKEDGEELKRQIERKKDPERIIKIATGKLGMVPIKKILVPDKEQQIKP